MRNDKDKRGPCSWRLFPDVDKRDVGSHVACAGGVSGSQMKEIGDERAEKHTVVLNYCREKKRWVCRPGCVRIRHEEVMVFGGLDGRDLIVGQAEGGEGEEEQVLQVCVHACMLVFADCLSHSCGLVHTSSYAHASACACNLNLSFSDGLSPSD